jgi:cytochrome c biogenesis protein CcdA
MSIYWSLKDVPELAALTPRQRGRVHESCLRRHFLTARATRQSVAIYAAFLLCSIALTLLVTNVPELLGFQFSIWFTVVGGTIGSFMGWFLLSRLAIPFLRPFYREIIEREL